MLFGIAITHDGSPTGNIIGWSSHNGKDKVWFSYAKALEANDLNGWTGYVRFYPSGLEVK